MKLLCIIILSLFILSASASEADWSTETFVLQSTALEKNKIGLAPEREVRVWLPPSYQHSKKRYPVIHYLHNYGWSNQKLETHDKVQDTFSRALTRGLIGEFIFVAGDYRVEEGLGTFFGNNEVSGRWVDHIIQELVPAIDQRYRTQPVASARGISGDFIGGYGALRVAMQNPEIFSSVYAIHPVGTDIGERLMRSAPDWERLNTIKNYDELRASDGATKAFLLMAQAFAPNPEKPPFFADFMVERIDGELEVNAQNTKKMQQEFLLSNVIEKHIAGLKRLRGIGFDWGRHDINTDHVYGNQKFTRMLAEYGIEHIAEEHNGGSWSETWVPYGRVENDMLPFFQRFLEFK